jgi:hypothetical protein
MKIDYSELVALFFFGIGIVDCPLNSFPGATFLPVFGT